MNITEKKLRDLIRQSILEQMSMPEEEPNMSQQPEEPAGPNASDPGEQMSVPEDPNRTPPKQKKANPWLRYAQRTARAMGTKDIKAAVVKAQEMAIEQGANIEPDGQYGPNTHKALVALQKKLGVKPDGIVGKGTMAAYQKKFPEKKAKPDPEMEKYRTTVTPLDKISPEQAAAKVKEIEKRILGIKRNPDRYASDKEYQRYLRSNQKTLARYKARAAEGGAEGAAAGEGGADKAGEMKKQQLAIKKPAKEVKIGDHYKKWNDTGIFIGEGADNVVLWTNGRLSIGVSKPKGGVSKIYNLNGKGIGFENGQMHFHAHDGKLPDDLGYRLHNSKIKPGTEQWGKYFKLITAPTVAVPEKKMNEDPEDCGLMLESVSPNDMALIMENWRKFS